MTKITDIIEWLSSNLYLMRHNDTVFVFDSYHLGDADFNYGIYASFNVDKKVVVDDIIPDAYINGYIDFLLRYDLKDHYEVDKKDISRLEAESFDNWGEILESLGYSDVSEALTPICNAFKEGTFLELSKTEKECMDKLVPGMYEYECAILSGELKEVA